MATTITANGINFPDGSASAPSIGGTDTNTGLFTGSDIVGFATGGVERIKIDAGGRVSIGNNPTVHSSTLFHVEDPGELNVKFEGSTSTLGARISLQNNDTTANSFSQYAFNDAGGQSTSAIQGINTDQTNNYGEMAFLTRNAQGSPPSERVRIDKDGNVGINDLTPSYKLDVNGTGRFTDNLTINTTKKIQTNSSQGQLTIQGGATYPGSAIKFAGGQSGATNRGQMIFYAGEETSLEERLRIDSGGDVLVGLTTTLSGNGTNLWVSDGTVARLGIEKTGSGACKTTIGAGSNRAFNVYNETADHEIIKAETDGDVQIVTGNLIIGTSGKGIDFSATANQSGVFTGGETLTDYEAGLYTPELLAWNGSSWATATLDAGNKNGSYVKIGNMVHVQVYISAFHINSAHDGQLAGFSLPIVADSGDTGFSVLCVNHENCFSSSGQTNLFVTAGQSRCCSIQEHTTSYNTWSGSTGRYVMFAGTYRAG